MRKKNNNVIKRLSKIVVAFAICATVMITNPVEAFADSGNVYIYEIDGDATSNSPYNSPDITLSIWGGKVYVGCNRNFSTRSGEINGGTYATNVFVTTQGVISGGTFGNIEHEIVNNGKIINGTHENGEARIPLISSTVENYGVISGGKYTAEVTTRAGSTIDGGEFTDGIRIQAGTISGGDFKGGNVNLLDGADAVITGSATFTNCTIKRAQSDGTVNINGGTFQGGTIKEGAIINSGTFSQYDAEDGTTSGINIDSGVTINGGEFSTGVNITDDSSVTINGGTFVGVTIPDNVTVANVQGQTIIFENCTMSDTLKATLDSNGVYYRTSRVDPVSSSGDSSGSASAQTTTESNDSTNSSTQALAVSIESSFVGADGVTYRRLTAAGNPSIYVQGDESYLPVGGHFSYIPALDGTDAYTIASGIVASRLRNVSNFSVIDMNLSDASHNAVHELSGNVYVTMPIPAGLTTTGKTLTVYRVDGPNTLTRCNTTIDGTSLTFTTNHFSTYVVVEQDGITSPKTGER